MSNQTPSLRDYNMQQFGGLLAEEISPAQPIRSIEHLLGRSKELLIIEKALFARGRHVFIYGDRGIGKSSLAATAAGKYQSDDANYIDVTCSPDATFCSVIASVVRQAVSESRILSTNHTYANDAIRLRDVGKQIKSSLDAVEVLREVATLHSKNPVAVVDEFDRMKDPSERAMFADLVKHLGDKDINIKFIFTGIATSLDQLLGSHFSAIRQFETIELPKLYWDDRWEITLAVAKKFGVAVPRDIYVRIAAVSDGYPYYVHLITEKLLWAVYERAGNLVVTWDDYQNALRGAIASISPELKRPYEKATLQQVDYESILWSTADNEMLYRHMDDMYTSYLYVMSELNQEPLERSKYAARVRNLQKPNFGEILKSGPKKGIYTYRENMFRGYVRLQAESNGLRLFGRTQGERPEQAIHVRARQRNIIRQNTGYQGGGIPRGINFGKK